MAASPLPSLSRNLQGTGWLGGPACESGQPVRVQKLSRWLGKGFAVEGVSRDTLIRLVDFPELPLRIHTRDTIKAGRTALLVRGEFPIGGRMVPVAYKRVQRRSRWKVLTAIVFGNRTLRTWRTALRFVRAGVPTASPLMVVMPRWYQPHRPSYAALEWLDQAMNLTHYAQWLEQCTAYSAGQRLNEAAAKLGEVIGRMHAAKISHRDLKAGNLLLINRPSSVEAYVIDLDGATYYPWLPGALRVRDLSRLALAMEALAIVTHAARLRFLRAYLQATTGSKTSWKALWRQVARWTLRRQTKKHKHEQPAS